MMGAPAVVLLPDAVLGRGRTTNGGFQIWRVRITMATTTSGSQRRNPGERIAETGG
jgi:hypothetical protein